MNRRSIWRRAVAVTGMLGLVAGVLTVGAPSASAAGQRATGSQSADSAAQTTRDYVIRYWPRTISFAQQAASAATSGLNQLIGPITMNDQFRTVVAINDDTIYSSAFADVRQGPVIMTIPATTARYSLLTLDLFGEVFDPGIPSQASGTFALVPKGWQGTLPAGITKITAPYDVTIWIFRADKYSATGVNTIAEATAFRANLRMRTLANYLADPNSGAPNIVSTFPTFAFSFKLAEDLAAQFTPNLFLRATQRAVHNPTTQPMYPSDLRLSRKFDETFQAAQQAARRGDPRTLRAMERAVGQAYQEIVARWKTHVIPGTHWTHFDNIAAWGTAYLDRAAATEYIQYGNNAAAAGYWNAWVDQRGRQLNGATHDYKLTFPADNLPDAERFWSLTAYTPRTVELIRNPENKYLVARYTPGLQYNVDGSVTIYMSVNKPANVPTANWLPVRRQAFNVDLRVYGPTGNTATGAGYTPPAITVAR